jgi:hypothetical protein
VDVFFPQMPDFHRYVPLPSEKKNRKESRISCQQGTAFVLVLELVLSIDSQYIYSYSNFEC